MADRMVAHDLIKNSDISGLIEDRFARSVDLTDIDDLDSVMK